MPPGKKRGGDRIFISASAAHSKNRKKCRENCFVENLLRKSGWKFVSGPTISREKSQACPNCVPPFFFVVNVHDFTQKRRKNTGSFPPLFFSLHFPLLWSKTSVWVSSIGWEIPYLKIENPLSLKEEELMSEDSLWLGLDFGGGKTFFSFENELDWPHAGNPSLFWGTWLRYILYFACLSNQVTEDAT